MEIDATKIMFTIIIIIIIIIFRYAGISSFDIPHTVNFFQYPVFRLFFVSFKYFALHLWIWSDEGMKPKRFFGTGHKLQSVAGWGGGGGGGLKILK